MVKMTYPDGKTVAYEYDVMGNLLTVTDWNDKVTAYEYDANNQLVKTTNWNGTTEIRTYNIAGQLTKLENLNGETVISSYTYEYDANGNIVKENDTVLGYDVLDRLTAAGTNKYRYSGLGNIESFSYVKNGSTLTRSYRYGSDNQLTNVGGKSTIVDKDGNLTSYNLLDATHTAAYDSKNRMTSYDGTTYAYDAENNRIGLTSNDVATDFVVDNDSSKYSRVLVETTGDSSKYHVYGNGLIGSYVDDAFETNHHDYRGSVTAVTDEAGAVVGEVSYDEYGVITSKDDSITTRFLYNGKYGVQTDSNGLYHMRARYYNPDLKRFMNRDVVAGSIEQSQTLNRYAFVNGNPISYNDPFGLAREMIANSVGLDNVHLFLDVVGVLPIPVLQQVTGGIQAGIYVATGDYPNAAMSVAGMLPGVGTAVKIDKLADTAGGVADLVDMGYNSNKLKDLVVAPYGSLKNDKTIPGQAHHLNQDAAFRDKIPKKDGLSVKLPGNAFKDVDSPHYLAHESLESFWSQYRDGGLKDGMTPTNGEYNKAVFDSMIAAGYTSNEATEIAAQARQQRLMKDLTDDIPVPRIPGKLNQKRR